MRLVELYPSLGLLAFSSTRFRSAIRILLQPVVAFIQNQNEYQFDAIRIGSQLSNATIRELEDFRRGIYEKKSPYLLTETHLSRIDEAEVDSRSYHVIARKSGEIVGCLRLTPAPFECQFAQESLAERLKKSRNYLEINRFVTTNRMPGLSRKLLFLAGTFLILETPFQGLIGICKTGNQNRFASFGLEPLGEVFHIPYRNRDEYVVMSAPNRRLVAHAFKYLILNRSKSPV